MNPSQLVRQELRAVVSGRTQQQSAGNPGGIAAGNNAIRRNLASPHGLSPNTGSMLDNNQTELLNQQMSGNINMNTSSDLDPRFNFDMPQGMNYSIY